MKHVLFSAATMLALAFTKKDKLTGRWESKPSPAGNVTGVVFKTDSSFEGYVNRKPFVTGYYSLSGDMFTFTDNGCEGKRGIYRIDFFSNDDSLRFIPVQDSCLDRMQGMSKLVMGRVKPADHAVE